VLLGLLGKNGSGKSTCLRSSRQTTILVLKVLLLLLERLCKNILNTEKTTVKAINALHVERSDSIHSSNCELTQETRYDILLLVS